MIQAISGGFSLSFNGSKITMSGFGDSGGGSKVIPLSSLRRLEVVGSGAGRVLVVFQGGMHAHALEPDERPQFEALATAVADARG